MLPNVSHCCRSNPEEWCPSGFIVAHSMLFIFKKTVNVRLGSLVIHSKVSADKFS